MTDSAGPQAGRGDPASTPADLQTDRPHPARVYDYLLGGTDNFPADRAAAEAGLKANPHSRIPPRENRAFMGRAVRYLAGHAGISQFLDIGTGIPTSPNVHEIAQEVDPAAHIVYVDNDPIVQRHAKTLLAGTPEGAIAFLGADLRDPGNILHEAAKTLDFGQPMAILLLGILHNIGDGDDPYGIVRRLVQAIPGGSYLAICHLTADIYPELADFARTLNERQLDMPLVLRDRAQITGFFEGVELVEPGVVQLSKWRPRSEAESAAAAALWGGVARKPA